MACAARHGQFYYRRGQRRPLKIHLHVYCESSAALAWILGEADGDSVWRELAKTAVVISSELTFLECDRGVRRAHEMGRLTEKEAAQCLDVVGNVIPRWHLLPIDRSILARARRSFPVEPVRSLDVVHLATILAVQREIPKLALLSLDQRIRENAKPLGIPLVLE